MNLRDIVPCLASRSRIAGATRGWAAALAALGWLAAGVVGCSDDNGAPYGSADNAGQACSAASQCYPGIDRAALEGEVVCLDRVEGGYCTHECNDDSNCCSVADECWSNLLQVCSPFESTDQKYCFLSCEDSDVADGAVRVGASSSITPDEYCSRYAHPSFHCRSSGGGSENRKVCVP